MLAPDSRLLALNDAPARDAEHVLYWMVAARRTERSFAMAHAAALALRHGVPLIVFEPLRVDYPFASERLHRFVIDGMRDNAEALRALRPAYYPYVEPSPGEGRGLLAALAARACVVVTDDWPCGFLPRMQRAAADAMDVRLVAVDGNGLAPIRLADRALKRAHDFRRLLHRVLPGELESWPSADPCANPDLEPAELPADVLARWPAAPSALLEGDPAALGALPIDHSVGVIEDRGGSAAARERLAAFVRSRLAGYGERAHPDADVASGLSPYLHFGHLGAHEVLHAIAEHEGWSPAEVRPEARGRRRGFWGTSEPAEDFLDQLVTWRELGFNACVNLPNYASYDSLPAWARRTLEAHAGDARAVYTLEVLERAETDDPIWNAAQRQLLSEGRIQNYLRMLWGKKILEWAPSPRVAAEWMIRLNDKYAVDGRDPNSYSGIFWVMGRYDRAWGPERAVFGKVRCMTSASARRKLRLREYLARFGEEGRTRGAR